jgi:hypothetical protein
VQLLEHFNYGICTIKGHELLDKYKEQNINKQQHITADIGLSIKRISL